MGKAGTEMTKKVKKIILAALILVVLIAAVAASYLLGRNDRSYYNADGTYRHIRPEHSFGYIENHPAFAAFSSFIQPWKDPLNQWGTPLLAIRTVCGVNRFNTDSIVDGFNLVIDAAQEGQIYYDFYTEQERLDDPSKEETGLVFIPGEKDAPVALVTAGGGFTCVCMFAEGFPVANALHQAGYNVFILKYRVNTDGGAFEDIAARQERYANEDFGRALQYIFQNQDALQVSMDGYSVWGFSAGGRTTFLWGLDNEFGYQHYGLPAPAAMMLAYSGWYDEQFAGQYGTMPPTYFAWLPNDDVIGEENANGIKKTIDFMRAEGLVVEDQAFYEAKHGFGEGRGTDAENWIADAAAFWEKQRAAEK